MILKLKKVNSEKDCAFLSQMRNNPNSPHNIALRCNDDFKNQSCQNW